MSRRINRRPSPAVAIALLALFVALGGGALAATSLTAGTITVCVSKRGGTLYKANGCKRQDASLTWDRRGPRGLTGPRGPRGIRGITGANGAVQGFEATEANPVDFTGATSEAPQTILTRSLPPGNFIVNAKTIASETHPSGVTALLVACTLSDGAKSDRADAWLPDTNIYTPTLGTTTLPLSIAVSSKAVSAVKLACWPQNITAGSQTFTAAHSVITAIQTTRNTTS
jgi:hypothetical protein